MDASNLKDIHRHFGALNLDQYPTVSFTKYYLYYPILKGMRPVRPLNLIPYVKNEAVKELELRMGFKGYPRKHGESVFTRFFQEYYLLQRFNIDKRIAHYSSEIVSKQMTREQALELLAKPLYQPGELLRDIDYLCRKLQIEQDEFQHYLNAPLEYSGKFKNWDNKYHSLKIMQSIFERISGKKVRLFS